MTGATICSRVFVGLVAALVGACATVPTSGELITGTGTQLSTRQIQTRDYETLDKQMTMRSVIATLQDLGFTIDEADADLGTITGTRHNDYPMRMTVTVVKREGKRVSVRANARIREQAVSDPATYQDFFVVLDKAMFLTLHEVD